MISRTVRDGLACLIRAMVPVTNGADSEVPLAMRCRAMASTPGAASVGFQPPLPSPRDDSGQMVSSEGFPPVPWLSDAATVTTCGLIPSMLNVLPGRAGRSPGFHKNEMRAHHHHGRPATGRIRRTLVERAVRDGKRRVV